MLGPTTKAEYLLTTLKNNGVIPTVVVNTWSLIQTLTQLKVDFRVKFNPETTSIFTRHEADEEFSSTKNKIMEMTGINL